MEMTNWQSDTKHISNCLKHILEFCDFSDVTFLFGDPPIQTKIQAHKLILAMRSVVFQTMFYGSMQEKSSEIMITDISHHVFEIMLKFIYKDEFQIEDTGEIIMTYYAAHKYHITHLMSLCREKLQSQLNGTNVSGIFQTALLLEDETLLNKCETIFSRNAKEVLISESFKTLSANSLKHLIQQNKLTISKESDLFKAIVNWAKYQVNMQEDISEESETEESGQLLAGKNDIKTYSAQIRSLVFPFLPYIKFLTINLEEFFKLPDLLLVLTDKEMVAIAMNISNIRQLPLPHWCTTDKRK